MRRNYRFLSESKGLYSGIQAADYAIIAAIQKPAIGRFYLFLLFILLSLQAGASHAVTT